MVRCTWVSTCAALWAENLVGMHGARFDVHAVARLKSAPERPAGHSQLLGGFGIESTRAIFFFDAVAQARHPMLQT